jgi:predicted permease
MSFLRRLAATFRKQKLQEEIDEELRYHLEARAQLNREEGHSAEEARAAALRQFGNPTLQREAATDADLFAWVETLGTDLRFALRLLRKKLFFSGFAILAMALGIGATTLMFSIVHSLLLEPLPYKDAGRLYMVWQKIPQEDRVSFSPREFLEYQQRSAAFAQLAAFTGNGFVLSGHGDPQLAIGEVVTPSYFQVLGVAPVLGRTFFEDEGATGHDREVVLSHGLWQERFAARTDVLGQAITMNGEPYTVVGVMPGDFAFPDTTYRLWVPAALRGPDFQQHPDAHLLRVVGRLKDGAGLSQMQAEIAGLGKSLDRDSEERHYYSVSVPEMISGELRRPLLVLLGAVALLLMIACANVSNMMLARATARRREMAVRAALGASRRRLIRQLLVETALLSLLGGAVGLLLAWSGLHILSAAGSRTIPELARVHIDFTVIVFAFLASAAAGIVFGLAPALHGSRTDLQGALKQGTQSSSTRTSERTRSVLVFAEIALCALLLVSFGLMLRSFVDLMHQEPGFAADGIVTVQTALMPRNYPAGPDLVRFYRSTAERLKQLPGVEAVAMTAYLPFGGNDWGNSFDIEGKVVPDSSSVRIRPVSAGYFRAMQIPLMQGREFSDGDTENSPGVAVINQALARSYFPNEDPIGRRIRYDVAWLTIVGVCGDIRHSSLDQPPEPEIYAAYPQIPPALLNFVGRDQNYVVRAAGTTDSIASGVRQALHVAAPEVVIKVNEMRELIRDTTAQPRLRTSLIAIFTGLALALAAVGIYAVLAYTVTQRFKELGIRIALGARSSDIRRLILGHALRLASLATASGLVAAYFLVHFLRTLLFGVAIHDPLTFVAVPLFMLAIALLAGYLPARQASRVSPTISLRQE